jgi:hypothetical protein
MEVNYGFHEATQNFLRNIQSRKDKFRRISERNIGQCVLRLVLTNLTSKVPKIKITVTFRLHQLPPPFQHLLFMEIPYERKVSFSET